jgi:hypothetical protein
MDNKALWDSVKVTDPSAVKAITGKSYQGSSPKPYWLIEKATEVFGPVGIGWGVTVKSERFERLSETDVLHVAVVSVWYVREGVRSESFDQMGGTQACYMTGAGKLKVDEDAGKKSVTDGMVKCLSMIGFAGDIFSGQWNDSKYVAWAAKQYADPPPPPKVPIITATSGVVIALERSSIVLDTAEAIKERFDADDLIGAYELYQSITDGDERTYLWRQLPSNMRTAIKKHGANLKETA